MNKIQVFKINKLEPGRFAEVHLDGVLLAIEFKNEDVFKLNGISYEMIEPDNILAFSSEEIVENIVILCTVTITPRNVEDYIQEV